MRLNHNNSDVCVNLVTLCTRASPSLMAASRSSGLVLRYDSMLGGMSFEANLFATSLVTPRDQRI